MLTVPSYGDSDTNKPTTYHLPTLAGGAPGDLRLPLLPHLWTPFSSEPTETLGAYEFLPLSLTGPHLLSFSVSSRLQRLVDHLPRGKWGDQRAFEKWLVSKNCWPKAILLLIIGFFTRPVLGNHCRVMMYYIAWKTSLNMLCRSDSITYHFPLMNKTVLLRGVITEYTECFLPLLPCCLTGTLKFGWFQLEPQTLAPRWSSEVARTHAHRNKIYSI